MLRSVSLSSLRVDTVRACRMSVWAEAFLTHRASRIAGGMGDERVGH
jgi:hypothetical protein